MMQYSSWSDDIYIDSAFTSSVVFRYEWAAASASSGCRQINVKVRTPDSNLIDQTVTTNYTFTDTLIEIHTASKTVKFKNVIETLIVYYVNNFLIACKYTSSLSICYLHVCKYLLY